MAAKFFQGSPCRNGHDGTRYRSNGSCVQCTKDQYKRWRSENREQVNRQKRVYRQKRGRSKE